jgi:hypothetical protein
MPTESPLGSGGGFHSEGVGCRTLEIDGVKGTGSLSGAPPSALGSTTLGSSCTFRGVSGGAPTPLFLWSLWDTLR